MRIRPNYLSSARDFEPLVAGVRIAREVARQRPMERWRGEEIFPGEAAQSDEALRAYIRKAAMPFHHVCGTCRMGSDDEAVVDTELRVRGVEGLRVVDASVFPDVVGANTNACVLMIGERAADLILGRPLLAPAIL